MNASFFLFLLKFLGDLPFFWMDKSMTFWVTLVLDASDSGGMASPVGINAIHSSRDTEPDAIVQACVHVLH